jgi:hypothetical protein
VHGGCRRGRRGRRGRRYRPDVCLLGLDAKGQGLRVTNEIVSRVPSAVVILLTNRLDEEEFMAAVRPARAAT